MVQRADLCRSDAERIEAIALLERITSAAGGAQVRLTTEFAESQEQAQRDAGVREQRIPSASRPRAPWPSTSPRPAAAGSSGSSRSLKSCTVRCLGPTPSSPRAARHSGGRRSWSRRRSGSRSRIGSRSTPPATSTGPTLRPVPETMTFLSAHLHVCQGVAAYAPRTREAGPGAPPATTARAARSWPAPTSASSRRGLQLRQDSPRLADRRPDRPVVGPHRAGQHADTPPIPQPAVRSTDHRHATRASAASTSLVDGSRSPEACRSCTLDSLTPTWVGESLGGFSGRVHAEAHRL